MSVKKKIYGAIIVSVGVLLSTVAGGALESDAARMAKPAPATAGTGKCDQKNFVAGELILKMKQGSSVYDLAKAEGLTVKKYGASTGIALLGIDIRKLTRFQGEALTLGACILLNRRPGVAYAELNGVQKAAAGIAPESAVPAPVSGCAAADFKAGEIVLKLRAGVDFKGFVASKKLKIINGPDNATGAGLVQIDIEGNSKEEAMTLTRSACMELSADPNVERADLNKVRRVY